MYVQLCKKKKITETEILHCNISKILWFCRVPILPFSSESIAICNYPRFRQHFHRSQMLRNDTYKTDLLKIRIVSYIINV